MNFFPSRALDSQGDLYRQAIGMAMANRQAAQRPAMGPAMYDPSVGRSLSAPTQERTMEYRMPGGGSQLKQLGEPMPMPSDKGIISAAVMPRPESYYFPQQQPQPMRMPSMSDMMTNMYGYGMSPFAGRGMGRMGGYGRQPMFGGMGGYGRQPMMPMFGGMGGYGRQPMMPMFGGMGGMFGGNYGRTPIQQPMQTMDMPRQQVVFEPAAPPSLPQYAAQLYGGFTPVAP